MPLESITRLLTGSPTLMAVHAWSLIGVTALSLLFIDRPLPGAVFTLALIPSVVAIGRIASPHRVPSIAAGSGALLHRHGARIGVPLAAIKEPPSGDSLSLIEQTMSIVLILVVVVAAGTTIFIILSPGEGEKFTEFYILGPKGKAADYPTEFMSRTPQTVIIGIGNQEYQDITYVVETFAVQSRFDAATNQSVIGSATLLDRFSVTVPHNQTVEQPYTFRIMDPNTDRLEFLLFKEAPPDDLNDHISASYRDLHLWLRVH